MKKSLMEWLLFGTGFLVILGSFFVMRTGWSLGVGAGIIIVALVSHRIEELVLGREGMKLKLYRQGLGVGLQALPKSQRFEKLLQDWVSATLLWTQNKNRS